MIESIHPDAHLEMLLASEELSEQRKSKLQALHHFCRVRFDRGERSFQPGEMARELADAAIMAASTYMNAATPIYTEFGKVWQSYADVVDLALNLNAPLGHPDAVLVQLLADPKRRGNAASSMRALHKVCRDRFNRGERNFSPAAVGRDAAQAGIFANAGTLSTTVGSRYAPMLLAWQSLADEHGPIPVKGIVEGAPEIVLRQRLQAPGVKSSTLELLNRVQEVCQTRFEQGEYDFGTPAMGKALIEANVFAADRSLTSRLGANERWSSILDAWQSRADALWIESDPELPPTNPHSVFRRLRGKAKRADKLETLLAVHRVCYLEHASGQKDFSTLTIGKLLAARGVLAERSLYNSLYADLRILTNAWDEYARPWLTKEGAPPPTVRLERRKSHNPDLDWVRRDYPQFEEWRELASEWLQTAGGGLGQRLAAINAFFEHYLKIEHVPNTPTEFLRRGVPLPDIAVVASNVSATNGKVTRLNYLHDFFQWVLLRNYSVEADDGELIVSPAFRNPLAKVAAPRGSGEHSQSVRSPLPYGYIHTLRRKLAQGLNFRDWTFAQGAQGVEEGEIGRPARDWFEVDRSLINEDDSDCVWRVRKLKKGRVVYQMWSPVRWVALLTKLLLPLRTGQIRLLDSGESDTWKYEAGQWRLSDHPLAEKSVRKPWHQGVFRRHIDPAKREADSTLLYISTNKTADMEKDGPYKGYTIPWFVAPDKLDDVFYWLEKLRDWQSKYNPIKRRVEWSELGDKHINAKTDGQLASYSPACFLFRLPEEPPELRGLPVTDGVLAYAWANLLEDLQTELAAKGETHPGGQPIIFMGRDEKGRIAFNDFPLHSLRVSLITAFALDGGVPFAILQKVVGHARLLMTLYYTKPGQARMTRVLTEAAAKLDRNKEESIHAFLLDVDHDTLVKKGISNNPAALAAAIPIRPADRNPAGWMLMHHGLCLVGGNVSEIEDNKKIGGCYNGGQDIGSPGHPMNGPVPGGSRNCVRCRWFVTEPHYLAALAAHFNTIAYHLDESRNRMMGAERTYQELLRQKAEQEFAGSVFTEQKQLLRAERIMESTMREFSDRAEDLVATWRLIERCKNVLNSGPADGWQLVIQGAAGDVEAVFEETESELLQLCGVCDNVELYPDLEADKAVLRRSQLLDSALYNEGLPPMFLKLSQEEQLKVGNAFMRSLSRHISPDSPFVGQRKVVEVIDAGGKLGKSLGINLVETVSKLNMGSTTPHRMKVEVVEE
jgi:hypothetical protein